MSVVIKVGGSILRDHDTICELYNDIKDLCDGNSIIVVSALKGVTDSLIGACGNGNAVEIGNEIYDRYKSLVGGFYDDESIKGIMQDMKKGLIDTAYVISSEEADEYTRNKFVSYGERLSTILLYSFLSYKGLKSAPVPYPVISTYKIDGDDIVDELGTINLLNKFMNKGAITIIPGFISIDDKGNSTTVGRGGSDYTATLVSKLLNIKNVVFITDVNGIMTADPRLISNSKIINELSIDEAVELAHLGAKKFHPKTFEPIIGTDIKVKIKGLSSDESTIISSKSDKNSIKGITLMDNLVEVKIESLSIVGKVGSASNILDEVKGCDVNIVSLAQPISETTIQLFIDAKDENKLIRELNKNEYIESIKSNRVSAVNVVGNKLLDKDTLGRIIKIASEYHLISFSLGVNDISSTFIMDFSDGIDFFRDLHKMIINKLI